MIYASESLMLKYDLGISEEKMTPQKITIFGGSGFVGRHIIRRLAKTGAVITVVTRDSETAKFLRPMGNVGQIGIVAQNLTDEDGLRRVMANQDAVINLIAILSEAKRGQFQAIHVDLPARLGRHRRKFWRTKIYSTECLGGQARSPRRLFTQPCGGRGCPAPTFSPCHDFAVKSDFWPRRPAL